MTPIKLFIGVVATLGLAYVSRASLRSPGTHGFYRFFAWEAILGLALLNEDYWFRDPFAWYQLVAWVLLGLSLFMVLHGVWLLRRLGKPDAQHDASPLLAFEKTTRLVVVGAYRYIRHPMYSSLLALAWGIFFKLPSWEGLVLGLAATFLLVATARAEETENLRFFGQSYRAYMQNTRMFIPYIF